MHIIQWYWTTMLPAVTEKFTCSLNFFYFALLLCFQCKILCSFYLFKVFLLKFIYQSCFFELFAHVNSDLQTSGSFKLGWRRYLLVATTCLSLSTYRCKFPTEYNTLIKLCHFHFTSKDCLISMFDLQLDMNINFSSEEWH